MLQMEKDRISAVHFLFEKPRELKNRVLGCIISVLDGTVSDLTGSSYAIQNKFSDANYTVLLYSELTTHSKSKSSQCMK